MTNASSVKITRLTNHQTDALEAGYQAGHIKVAVTKTTADWFDGITPARALAQVKNYQAELKVRNGARGGHYQALHAVASKLVKLMETWVAPEVTPEPAADATFEYDNSDAHPSDQARAKAEQQMYSAPLVSYKPAPRGLRVLAGNGPRQEPLTQKLNWTLEVAAKTTEEARQKMQELLDPAAEDAQSYDWVAMQVGLKANWVTLDIRDKAHAFSSYDHQKQDVFAHLVKSLGTVEGAEALLALMGCELGDVEDWAAEHRRHYAFLNTPAEPVKAEPAKRTFVEVTFGVTAGELELFRKLAQDAGNWSGTPLLPLISPQEKGYFTSLKKRGLMGSFVDSGCVFATFSKTGALMAKELYGVEIETTY